uniref:Uncharacterized protein n=1 Tax=Alexandrium monilatum TaxID=311494 RepID=A0A7S4Q1N8_9DINO
MHMQADARMSGFVHAKVSLARAEIRGHEDVAVPTKASSSARGLEPWFDASALGSDGDEASQVARVLMELGVSLDIIPVDEDAERSRTVDASTKQLLAELQGRRKTLMQAMKFGDAQQLSEHMQHLGTLGADLRGLQEKLDRYVTAGELLEAQRIADRMLMLEEQRLSIAALYETDFWLERMILQQA